MIPEMLVQKGIKNSEWITIRKSRLVQFKSPQCKKVLRDENVTIRKTDLKDRSERGEVKGETEYDRGVQEVLSQVLQEGKEDGGVQGLKPKFCQRHDGV